MLATCLFICAAAFSQDNVLSGRVCDQDGNPIPSAIVQSRSATVRTDSNGNFQLVLSVKDEKVQISAAGFAPLQFTYHKGDSPRQWTLKLPTIEQRISVSADAHSRTATEISGTELHRQPALSTDEVLRSIPGFSLFRRTPSSSSNPTTQGVSLRGSGASGASRALVLLDGVPLNDPFGGWIYWGRVPPDSVTSATVIEGGSSEILGTQAMGGVVELARPPEAGSHLTSTAYSGNLFTSGATVLGDKEGNRWWIGGGVSMFRTNGYVPIAPSQRGTVDTVLNSKNVSGWLRLQRDISPATRVFLASTIYGEQRKNGTYLQKNSATIRELRTGADWNSYDYGSFSARMYGGTENLTQTFSAIAPDRATESLTREQWVPVSQWGLSGVWSRNVGGRQFLMAGTDAGWIQGNTEELGYLSGFPNARFLSGGTQWRAAGFVEDRIRLGNRTLLSAALRWDHWDNVGGRTTTIPLASLTTATSTEFPDRSENFVSPRVGISFAANSRLLFYASASRSFRSPTLNELYRGFRVGNVLTLANAGLTSEQQTGVEAGATVRLSEQHEIRVAYFWNQIDNPIANVTLSVTPNLITRQRQNLGSLRSPGAEFSWKARWNNLISTTVAYQYVDAEVSSFPPDSSLLNKWIPQVAHNNASAQIRFVKPNGFNCTIGARYQGRQYDDDRNLFLLGGYFVTDAYVSKDVRKNLVLFAGVQNLLNRRYEVGRTPSTSMGPPILGRIGLRFLLGEN